MPNPEHQRLDIMNGKLHQLGVSVDNASARLAEAIDQASKSGEILQQELVTLNRRLFWATVVIAIATIGGVIAAFLQWAA